MKKFLFAVLGLLLFVAVYYAAWHSYIASDVARIQATLTYQNDQFRGNNRWIELKADGVYGSGFPFNAYVHVERPTITFVWSDETYGVSLAYADFHPRGESNGIYEVTYPATGQAVYAKSGQAPENYDVTPVPHMALMMRASPDSNRCSSLPGPGHCPPVGETDPLISYAPQIPPALVLNVLENGETKQVSFSQPLAVSEPVYMTIPADMSQPIQTLVNMLREAYRKQF